MMDVEEAGAGGSAPAEDGVEKLAVAPAIESQEKFVPAACFTIERSVSMDARVMRTQRTAIRHFHVLLYTFVPVVPRYLPFCRGFGSAGGEWCSRPSGAGDIPPPAHVVGLFGGAPGDGQTHTTPPYPSL